MSTDQGGWLAVRARTRAGAGAWAVAVSTAVAAAAVAHLTIAAVGKAAVVVEAAGSAAQAPGRRQPPDAAPQPASWPAIVKRRLSNGLPVWIAEQPGLPVVQMSLQVLTGTDADPPGRYGLASLTAAMLTEGAGSRSGAEIADTLDGWQANLSATSTSDSSSVQLHVPVGQLGAALPFLADVSQRPTFPAQSLDRVRQRRLAALSNAREDPDALAALAFARELFGPLQRNAVGPMGTRASLEALTVEDVRRFHAATYRPDNSTMLVVGDVDPDDLMQRLEPLFGVWRPAAASGAQQATASPQRPDRQLTLIDVPDAPQSRILVGTVGPAAAVADLFPLQLLTTVLDGRFSAGRNQTLRADTTGVRSGFEMRKSARLFVVGTAAAADRTVDVLRDLLGELTAAMTAIPENELARAKDGVAGRFAAAFAESGRMSNRLQALISMVVYDLPDDYYATYVSSIRAVGAPDVQRVARQYLEPDHLIIVVVGDRKSIEPSLRAQKIAPVTSVGVDGLLGPAK